MNKTDTRYPYTYAADYLRVEVNPYSDEHFSRADMSRIQQIIADALGIDKTTISKALADKYIEQNTP